MRRALPALLLMLATATAMAQPARQLTDAQVRERIIADSIRGYLLTGHPCACPYNSARNGSRCGARSAYTRPGGAAPLCYARDVSDAMVRAWRQSNGMP